MNRIEYVLCDLFSVYGVCNNNVLFAIMKYCIVETEYTLIIISVLSSHNCTYNIVKVYNVVDTPVLHQFCYTSSVTPVLHQYCYTSITPVLHQCYTTSATPVLHQYCYHSVTPVLLHQYYTSTVTPVLHQYCYTCVTSVLLPRCYTGTVTPVLHRYDDTSVTPVRLHPKTVTVCSNKFVF